MRTDRFYRARYVRHDSKSFLRLTHANRNETILPIANHEYGRSSNKDRAYSGGSVLW